MTTPTAAPNLVSIGLPGEADLVYRYLASGGPVMVGQASRALGLPPRLLRRLLDELADVGAARCRSQHGSRRWSAVPADEVRSEVGRRHREAGLARLRLQRDLAGPSRLGLAQDTPATRLLCGLTRARHRLGELVARERFEHLVLNPDPLIDVEAVCTAAPVHTALVSHKVEIKELGVRPGPGDATQALTEELLAEGAQFRVLPNVPAKVLILDRTTALVRLDPADPNRGLMEITDPDTVARLVELFFRQWHGARDFLDLMEPEVALSTREQAILRLLAEGHTDKSAAQSLGLSVRTVAYSLSELMARLGVVNRLQLGIKIAPLLAEDTQRTETP